jgi:hypothetical protein
MFKSMFALIRRAAAAVERGNRAVAVGSDAAEGTRRTAACLCP